jgi:hypothetical protein
MAYRRTNFTISDINHHWLQAQAPNERAMSRLVDDLIQRERTVGPIERLLKTQADRLEKMLEQTGGREVQSA